MFKHLSILATAAAAVLFFTVVADSYAEEGNTKRGRVYYKMVCSACHLSTAGEVISPNNRTMSEWKEYFAADKHDASGKTNPSVKYYLSKEYRESIKDSNAAAAKFLDMDEAQLYADVHDFAVSGAKDSDTPASCE